MRSQFKYSTLDFTGITKPLCIKHSDFEIPVKSSVSYLNYYFNVLSIYVKQRYLTLQQCSRFGELRKKTSVHEWHLIVSSILWNVTNLVVKMLIFFFILILLSKKFRFIGTLTKRKELFDNICRASAYIRTWCTCTLQTRTLTKRYLCQIFLYLQPCRWTSICVVIISSANVIHAINI